MRVYETPDVGSLIRARRRELGLTQIQLAALSGSGTRFISDIESGKATMQIGKILDLLNLLGLDVFIAKRGEQP